MIRLGPEYCQRLDEAITREWLVTNGRGGYASTTLPGTPTRRYHGLLVAPGSAPGSLAVLLNQCEEMLSYSGRAYQISTMEYEDGTVAPAGYVHIREFRLDRGLPVTTFEIGDTTLEKRMWMAYGRCVTYVQYRLADDAQEAIELRLRPLVSGRTVEMLQRGDAWRHVPVHEAADGCTLQFDHLGRMLELRLLGGRFEAQPDWYWRVLYRRERQQGLDYLEDLYTPGVLAVRIEPGETATLVVSSDESARAILEPDAAWKLEWRRRGALLQRAARPAGDSLGQALVLAADAFVTLGEPAGAQIEPRPGAIVTGYQWPTGSVRDVLLCLPGLTLVPRRSNEGRAILTALVAQRRDGLLPVRYTAPDGTPDYASADTTLWLFVALQAYLKWSNDESLIDELWPALVEIVAAHEQGTRFGIGVDPMDGLLRASEKGRALTWMDAEVGDWVVTPRRGKPVEVNALWYNALRQMAVWSERRDSPRAVAYAQRAEWVESSFNRRYWYAPGGYLYDVIDTETGDDVTLRPNQVLAISLPFAVLARDRQRPVIDVVTDHLLTPYGLRTLSPNDPHYIGWYAGDPIHRVTARYQGTVVPWLLGPYCDAYHRVYRNHESLAERLRVFEKHLKVAGLGTISELFDGDAPHSPQGAIASATAVGELLRIWTLVTTEGKERGDET